MDSKSQYHSSIFHSQFIPHCLGWAVLVLGTPLISPDLSLHPPSLDPIIQCTQCLDCFLSIKTSDVTHFLHWVTPCSVSVTDGLVQTNWFLAQGVNLDKLTSSVRCRDGYQEGHHLFNSIQVTSPQWFGINELWPQESTSLFSS